MGLIEDIGAGPVGLDTAIFIYFIEEHPEFLPLVEPLFTAIDAGSLEGVTSALTLLETLVTPYRAGNTALAERYEAHLTRSRGVRMIELDRPLLRAAAQLRASAGVKTPDALQLAAGLATNCTAYLTNDRDLPSIPGLRILQLRNYVSHDSTSTPSS
jgi:predicted nucleic acid-binding protein